MRVQEKMHHINVTLNGPGADLVAAFRQDSHDEVAW